MQLVIVALASYDSINLASPEPQSTSRLRLKYDGAMQAKLTLELEHHLIERAERFARASGKSVSELVADYLTQLGQQETLDEETLPPITRSLSGILEGVNIDEAEYYRHLARKHS